MKNKTKQNLIKDISDSTSTSVPAVELMLNAAIKAIKRYAREGTDLQIRGFGSFQAVTRKARKARDIRRDKQIDIVERKIVKFKQYFKIK